MTKEKTKINIEDRDKLVEIFLQINIRDFAHDESFTYQLFTRILSLKTISDENVYSMDKFVEILNYYKQYGLDLTDKYDVKKSIKDKLYTFLTTSFKSKDLNIVKQPFNTIELRNQNPNKNGVIQPKSGEYIKKKYFNTESPIESTSSTELSASLLQEIESCRENGTKIDTGFEDKEFISNTIGCENCIDGYRINENGGLDFCSCYLRENLKVKSRKALIPEDYISIETIPTENLSVSQCMFSVNNNKIIDINIMLQNFEKNIDRIKNEGWNLMFFGTNGAGKSTCASICLKAALKNGYTAKYVVCQMLRKVWTGQKLNEELEQLKEDMYNVDFLVLDDLGQEFVSNQSEHQITEFDLLLRERTSKNKVTIFTTNAEESELKKRYGDRIYSLLKKKMVHITMYRENDLRTAIEEPDFLF